MCKINDAQHRPREGGRHWVNNDRQTWKACGLREAVVAVEAEQTRSAQLARAFHGPRDGNTNAQLSRHPMAQDVTGRAGVRFRVRNEVLKALAGWAGAPGWVRSA